MAKPRISLWGIVRKIESNSGLFNLKYKDVNIQVNFDREDKDLCIFVFSRYTRIPNRKRLNEIKEIFNCNAVQFVDSDGDEPAFWSLNWNILGGRKWGRKYKRS